MSTNPTAAAYRLPDSRHVLRPGDRGELARFTRGALAERRELERIRTRRQFPGAPLSSCGRLDDLAEQIDGWETGPLFGPRAASADRRALPRDYRRRAMTFAHALDYLTDDEEPTVVAALDAFAHQTARANIHQTDAEIIRRHDLIGTPAA